MLGRLVTISLLALVLAAPPAVAHDHVKVLGDRYELTIGFESEPVYVDEPNGVTLRVVDGDGKNVTGLEQTLDVVVSIGGANVTLDLAPAFRAPGSYVARFIPTAAGTYSFRFVGTIASEPLDYAHTYSNEPVASRGEVEFPDKGLSNVDTQKKLAALEARVAQLEQDGGRRDSPTPVVLALVAVAGVALLRRR